MCVILDAFELVGVYPLAVLNIRLVSHGGRHNFVCKGVKVIGATLV